MSQKSRQRLICLAKRRRNTAIVALFAVSALCCAYFSLSALYSLNGLSPGRGDREGDWIGVDSPSMIRDKHELERGGFFRRLVGSRVIETIGQQHPIKQKRVKRQILHDNAHQYKAEFEHLADGPKEIAKTYPPSCGSKKASKLGHNHTFADDVPQDVFPTDLFTLEQRQQGAILLHLCGLVYMFVALAIVCDEFFVPALDAITESLSISDDVAGATFMAAGGSAPEFFTSLFGVFITENNVGVGTIVGSATFNILCVLAFCTLFSKLILRLTWWPLFRDMFFYTTALAFLVVFFLDERIEWAEALTMFLIYVVYAVFMKYNALIEYYVKRQLQGRRIGVTTQVNGNFTTAQQAEFGRLRATQIGSHNISDVNRTGEPNRRGDEVSPVEDIRLVVSDNFVSSAAEGPAAHKSIPVLHSGAIFRTGIVNMVFDPRLLLHNPNLAVSVSNSQRRPPPVIVERIRRPESADSSIIATRRRRASRSWPTRKLSKTFSSPSFSVNSPSHNAPFQLNLSTIYSSSETSSGDRRLMVATEPEGSGGSEALLPMVSSASSSTNTTVLLPMSYSTSPFEVIEQQPLGDYRSSGMIHCVNATQSRPPTSDNNYCNVNGFGVAEPLSVTSLANSRPSTAFSSSSVSAFNVVSVSDEASPKDAQLDEPIDLSFPTTLYKQCVYLTIAPIMYPLYYTLPDVKKPGLKKYAPFTFFGSILWIALFSYLMIWWANTIGTTVGISTEVMGLTVLAAGTSIPDLITSVLVSRKGLGDMAVSSSIGSNLFDICIGLPVPWLLYFVVSLLRDGSLPTPVSVESDGLLCSVGMLFVMLIVLLASIIASGWKMNKLFGLVMIVAYVLSCVLSVMLEKRVFSCPLRIVVPC